MIVIEDKRVFIAAGIEVRPSANCVLPVPPPFSSFSIVIIHSPSQRRGCPMEACIA